MCHGKEGMLEFVAAEACGRGSTCFGKSVKGGSKAGPGCNPQD